MYPDCKQRNCEILGLSFDSIPSHIAWMHQLHTSSGVHILFPLISDADRSIAKKYNMIAPNSQQSQPIRSVFFIDPKQRVRSIFQYPITNGRSTVELLRLLDAMQETDRDNILTPVNWSPTEQRHSASRGMVNNISENEFIRNMAF